MVDEVRQNGPAGDPVPASGKYILIVDDEMHNLRLLSQTLKHAGHRSQTASDGERALHIAATTQPDLILLDIMMPIISGYEVCKRLKADAHTRDIPVIFISALDETEHKVTALEIGGVDYITKPIQPKEVLARVQIHLTLHDLQKQLEGKNRQLESEISQHQQTEIALRDYRDHLEELVAARVADLEKEMARRKQLETQLQDYAQHLEELVAAKVHELKLERAKVLQAAKLAALGEMATGVAHELNQPLTAILLDADYLKMLVQQVKTGTLTLNLDELYQIGADLGEDVARARRITDHLRAFGRIAKGNVVKINVNQPLVDSTILIQERFRLHNIVLHWELGSDLPLIAANPNQLEQVFLNLINNAEYALDEMEHRLKAGGAQRPDYHKSLTLATRYVPTEEFPVQDAPDKAVAGWIVIEVRDNGCGISPAHQARLFEPFFTTKPIGEGTGLGLSSSYGIVTEFGGEITCASTENEGTTFTVQFPVLSEQAQPASPGSPAADENVPTDF